MIEEKENALRIILTKYKFKEIEIDKICKDLKGKDINIGNAESILEKLEDLGVIRSTGVIKKIAKILQECRLNNLNDISNVLSDPKNNHLFKEEEEEKEGAIQEILGKAGSILFNADKEKLQGVIDALKGANLNPTTVMVRCSTLFKQANGERIERLVEILEEFDLSPKLIEQCTSLLTQNSNEEIEQIIKALQENFPKDSNYTYIDIINSCPYILAKGKADQITGINNKLKDLFYTFDSSEPSKYSSLYEQLIHECPSIFTQTADEIENIDNILRNLFINLEDEEGDFPSLYDKFIYDSPSIFVDAKSHELENTNNTLKELFAEIPDEKYGNLYNKIIRQKPSVITENHEKIKEIFNILNDEKYYIQNPDKDIKNSYSIISNCPSIFRTTTKKFEDMGIILKSIFKDNNKSYSKILSECGSIISQGDPIEIGKINDTLSQLFGNKKVKDKKYNSLYEKIVNECPTIFAQGSTDEINKIKNILGNDFITLVDKCPTILAMGKADNIKGVNTTLSQLFGNIKVKNKEYNSLYDKIINECPYVFATGSTDEINKIKNVLGNDFITIVDKCPYILAQGKANNIKSVNDTLSQLFGNIEVKGKEYNSLYDKIINECPTVFTTGSTDEINKIKNVLGDDFIAFVDKCPTILARGKADNIKGINTTLSQLFGNIKVKNKEYNSLYDKIINECPTIFAQGSTDEINKIKDYFGNNFIAFIDKCPYILAKGKADNIKSVNDTLSQLFSNIKVKGKEYNSLYDKIINECPTIFAEGSVDEINKIKNVLGNDFIILIDKCPSILAHGKADEIQNIKDVLGEYYIPLVSKCPTILARGDSKTIQEVKDELGENFFQLAYENPTKVLKLKTQEDFDMDIDQIEQNDDGQDIN